MSAFWAIVLGGTLTVAGGLFVNEATALAPFFAKRLVVWAAYRWASSPRMAEVYAEEWSALVGACPGKLTKLFTALTLAGAAASRSLGRSPVGPARALRAWLGSPGPVFTGQVMTVVAVFTSAIIAMIDQEWSEPLAWGASVLAVTVTVTFVRVVAGLTGSRRVRRRGRRQLAARPSDRLLRGGIGEDGAGAGRGPT